MMCVRMYVSVTHRNVAVTSRGNIGTVSGALIIYKVHRKIWLLYKIAGKWE